MWDSIAVAIIVGAAALWFAARLWRSWRDASRGRGCSCAGCGEQSSCAAVKMAARLNDVERSGGEAGKRAAP
ncbi:MAG: FeoB-associated Cys-rich membrane protein [Deltaproteobacteria bacterium]|jgi:hypothetical protein|nr:FeoB-associated Cys-rich membrane protein [Deltaproteobacteria bacterium]MBW2532110.1 FeoB-associated Cys-rich membrane protein [Deltaproteobacteria bacterium]